MTETLARINAMGHIELIDETMAAIQNVSPMTPYAAASLARGSRKA